MTVEPSEFYRQRLREASPTRAPGDRRDAFERDRDRILYSSAFRRLAGVAQVAAVREQHLLHNRLTHSLKVGQIGRRLAQRLLEENDEFHGGLGLDNRRWLPDIVESAGLAHDIGHPPFGHAVEEVMKRRMSAFGGFEGNAQSFRVVTKLAVRAEEYDGLDLTRATLNAILKYPRYVTTAHEGDPPQWHDRSHGEKWGVYRSEKSDFEFARSHPGGGGVADEFPCDCGQVRSAAAVLMDWADDISYVTHDVYDYFRAGLMPLDALSDRERKFLEYAASNLKWPKDQWPDFETAYGAIKDDMPKTAWGETRADRVQLYRILNKLITRFMNAVEVASPSTVTVRAEEQRQAEVLKQLTFFHVIERPKLALAQEGQKKIVGKLFDGLLKVYAPKAGRMGSGKWPILLQDFHARLMRECDAGEYLWADEERASRAVCDYICLLTEDQAVDLYSRMTGLSVSQGSIFGAWFD